MARYNTLAAYSNHHGNADLHHHTGSTHAEIPRWAGSRFRPDSDLGRLTREAKDDIERAAEELAIALAAEPPPTIRVSRRGSTHA